LAVGDQAVIGAEESGGEMAVVPLSTSHPGTQRIAAAVQASLDEMVAAATEAIWAEVPAYASSRDDQLREDVAAHVRAIFLAFLAGLTTGQPARRADFAVTREQATRRVAQGISLADFLQAFRIGQLTLWQGVLDAAGEDAAAREAALLVVAHIMQLIELGSTIAGEAYVAAQQHVLAEGDRVRRDLLEDLLARRAPITETDLLAWCKRNMAAYKYPRIVEFRDSLPVTATGKILKRELVHAEPVAAGSGS